MTKFDHPEVILCGQPMLESSYELIKTCIQLCVKHACYFQELNTSNFISTSLIMDDSTTNKGN